MEKLTKASICYTFARDADPALRVRAGEAFCLETEDVYRGAIVRPEDEMPRAVRLNPATGPVFIDGAQRGGTLRVDIERIQLREYAVMAEPATRVFRMRHDGLHVGGRLWLPLRPMIGLIGVAPRRGPAPTTSVGEHGGSLDCPHVGVSCSVFLPIGCDGALLAAGCVHVVMADGKIAGCGAEVSAEITLRARPVTNPLPTPCVETGDALVFLGSGSTLDDCRDLAIEKAATFLVDWLAMTTDDALVLLGLAGNLGVCRAVGEQKTMQLVLAKAVLAPLGLADVPALQRRSSEFVP
jgi:amidase